MRKPFRQHGASGRTLLLQLEVELITDLLRLRRPERIFRGYPLAQANFLERVIAQS